MIEKSITLKHTGFVFGGEVVAEMYSGEQETIKMRSSRYYDTSFEPDASNVTTFINTNGHAVKRIISAIVRVFLDYEGHQVFYDEFLINF